MKQKSLKNKAVFLDRDGTIIEQIEELTKFSQIRVLPRVAEAIRILNEKFLVIVITNQPVVGKRLITKSGVIRLNKRLANQLRKKGAKINAFYVCPHRHWDDCSCRKPKLGMVRAAAKKCKIDLKRSFIVGDDLRDIETGRRAKIKTILVKTGNAGKDKKFFNLKPDFVARDLLGAARIIQRIKL